MNGLWFRLYCDFPNNHKLRMLPQETQLFFVWLMCLHKDEHLVGQTPEQIAWTLRVSPEEAVSHIARLTAANLILKDLSPKGWDERQYDSDNSTGRWRKWRDKHHSNKLQTFDKRLNKQVSNVVESESESESDTEKEKSKNAHATPAGAVNGKYESAIRACREHPSFRSVPEIAIINTLRGHDEAKWMPAIEAMVRHYAGADMLKPCGKLENYLVGKRTVGNRQERERVRCAE
jgi:hypothetical protein